MATATDFTELHRQLVDQLEGLTSGTDWLGWLESARLFHRYSPQNQMLLRAQGATGHVASYRTWQRIPAADGGTCQVRRGERGLTILAPLTVTRREIDEATGDEIVTGAGIRGFKPVKVFHQGQLVSPPTIAEQPMPALLTGDNRWQHVWAAVQSHLTDLGYDIELHTRTPRETWNGRTDFTATRVEVADDLEPPQQLKTLIHEWAHIALGHADLTATGRREVLEVEAESVASLVCSTIGLDSGSYSVPYLASWSQGDLALVERTASRVLSTTAALVSTLETELSIELTPDLLTAANVAPVSVLADRSPRRGDTRPVVIAHLDSPGTDPVIDAAPADVQPHLSRLERGDRRQLLDALDRLDSDLDIVTALCADAGMDAATTIELLTRRGADPGELRRAMTRPVADLAGIELPLFTDISLHTDTATREPHACAAVEMLDRADRDVLNKFDLTRRDHVVTASTILSSITGVDAATAIELLAGHGASRVDIEYALRSRSYQPDRGGLGTNWPEAEIEAALTPSPIPGSNPSADSTQQVPIVALIREVADGNDPHRIVALADALALGHSETVGLCAQAGLSPTLTASAAMLRRQGNIEQASDDLEHGWASPPGDDWSAYLPAPGPPLSAAQEILAQWASLSAATSTPTPEIR